ncbi:MAG: exopolysaccharide biosynthesis protein [Pseudomonadota bacterium]
MLASAYAVAGQFARARLSHLASAEERSWTSAAVGLMALIVVMPIPFGNVLPALAMAALAICVTAGVMLMAWVWGREWLLSLL